MAIFDIFQIINLELSMGSWYILFYHLKLTNLRDWFHILGQISEFLAIFSDYSYFGVKMAIFDIFQLINLGLPVESCYLFYYLKYRIVLNKRAC